MLHVSQLSLRSAYGQGLFSGHPAAKELWLENGRNEQITCLTYTWERPACERYVHLHISLCVP